MKSITNDERIKKLKGVVGQMGLFRSDYYLQRNQDVRAADVDPLEHYLVAGDREGRKPNFLFDPTWYRAKYGLAAAVGALVHYVTVGERQGMAPSSFFNPAFYAEKYGLDPNKVCVLAHYLQTSRNDLSLPNPYFDPAFYLAQYPDVKAAGIDPYEHFVEYGYRENRRPNPDFDVDFVRSTLCSHRPEAHAFAVYCEYGNVLGWPSSAAGDSENIAAYVRRNVAPSQDFEGEVRRVSRRRDRGKVVAFYLPQFHEIPENNVWWGKGFTEWTNLSRGLPRFAGHYQPRVPRDLGFYDLADPSVMRRQVAMAKQAGIGAFCFYYYNFGGKRLLEKPIDQFLADDSLDFQFCLTWANENWTRRWDGMDKEVLMEQTYGDLETELVPDVLRHFKDPRYLRVDGRPLFLIYRADVIPECRHVVEKLRHAFRKHEFDPLIVIAQSFKNLDPSDSGCDGAVEFPPHKVTAGRLLNPSLRFFPGSTDLKVFSYDDVVAASTSEALPTFPLIKTAMPSWDNDARRQGAGVAIHGSTPQKFQGWLKALLAVASEHPFYGEKLVFINAWNEWGEGTYLEPDVHYGFAYLNSVSRALDEREVRSDKRRLILMGHDAFQAGAQHLLMNIGECLQREFGIEIVFVLLAGGRLLPQYEERARTFVLEGVEFQDRVKLFETLFQDGYRAAICNTSATLPAVSAMDSRPFRRISLVHELPRLLKEKHLGDVVRQELPKFQTIVFSAEFVREKVRSELDLPLNNSILLPQGLYKQLPPPAAPRSSSSKQRSKPSSSFFTVTNIGYGDLRKGLDIFSALAREVYRSDKNVRFVWKGDIDPTAKVWFVDSAEERTGNISFLPYDEDVSDVLHNTDVFFITSREDPFPSVMLEALACGKEVIAFAGAGGHSDLLTNHSELGRVLELGPIHEIAKQLLAVKGEYLKLSDKQKRHNEQRRRDFISTRYNFAQYCFELYRCIETIPKVSVVVPVYNQAAYVAGRLDTIFAQSFPVYEVIIIDDASTDDSVKVMREYLEGKARNVKLVVNKDNTGSPIVVWHQGVKLATGELIWIAEADDSSKPGFLDALVAEAQDVDDLVFAFSDSVAIDETGATVFPSYKEYYRQSGAEELCDSGAFAAEEFLEKFLSVRNLVLNASAVLWRRDKFLSAWERLTRTELTFRGAGDWMLYACAAQERGNIVFHKEELNLHRRHAAAVTFSTQKRKRLAEIRKIHQYLDKVLGKAFREERDAYRKQLAKQS